MTDEQLVEIERLAEAATPGSWKSGWSWQDAINGGKSAWSEGPVHVGDTLSQVAPQAIADAAFIAAARDAVPALVAEVRRLQDDAIRLGHYRQFVVQISEALGVPDDSMILPYAQKIAAEVTRLQAELAAVPMDGIRNAYARSLAFSFLCTTTDEDDAKMDALGEWLDTQDTTPPAAVDNPPTSGFFTSGRWDFSEA